MLKSIIQMHIDCFNGIIINRTSLKPSLTVYYTNIHGVIEMDNNNLFSIRPLTQL